LEVECVLEPQPLREQLAAIFNTALVPVVFILTGFLVFLFKPNDERSFLLALLLSWPQAYVRANSPLLFKITAFLGNIAVSFAIVFMLHLFLIFPERSPLLRRFPRLAYLSYLPALFVLLPYKVLYDLDTAGWGETANLKIQDWFYPLTFGVNVLYALAIFPVIILTYLRADMVVRRKLRLIFASLLCWLILGICLGLWMEFLSPALGIRIPYQDWANFIIPALALLIPLSFAYAIVRHKVIPVSFVIRRSLQYLLAKNALRLLLILPIAGIVWNIAANPARPLDEILLRNSTAFYVLIGLAVALVLLNRFGLREWIDRKFFREQYNQERLLRELIEDVKESDSLPKLSRLVSSRIQSALHPTSVYLFYRDDEHNSDFSLGGKKSEIPYTQHDRELLETLANQIALVQENLSLKDRVRREQKIRTE
ncbi:MAG: hypothetical protein ICV86_15040, partial [Microcoleus sp. T3-bin5]|nr:hypothetical protein [Microcoleus sp. T3-bin5]